MACGGERAWDAWFESSGFAVCSARWSANLLGVCGVLRNVILRVVVGLSGKNACSGLRPNCPASGSGFSIDSDDRPLSILESVEPCSSIQLCFRVGKVGLSTFTIGNCPKLCSKNAQSIALKAVGQVILTCYLLCPNLRARSSGVLYNHGQPHSNGPSSRDAWNDCRKTH